MHAGAATAGNMMPDSLSEWSFFRPEVIEAMRAAYRMACDSPQLRYSADERTAIVAEKIVELARSGETDPGRLCTGALCRLSH
jgi:hypothetical protein